MPGARLLLSAAICLIGLAAAGGTFRGENGFEANGFAANGVARVTENVFAHAGVGFGSNRGVGGRAGVTCASSRVWL